MKYQVVDHNKIERAKWQEYVDNHKHGTIFHTPYMYDVNSTVSNHNPYSLFVVDNKDDIQAMLSGYIQTVKSGIFAPLSKRSLLFQAPIHNDNDSLEYLLQGYNGFIKDQAIFTEIRNHYQLQSVQNPYKDGGYRYEDHLNILIDLTKSEDTLWKEVHSKRRNEIRKAQKEGVEFSVINKSEIELFYEILREVYYRARLPLLPIVFFEQAINYTRNKQGMIVFGAYFEGKLIGCMITLVFKNTIYDLYAGSYYQYYNKNPNDLIPWEVFKWGKEHGFKVFDFGGVGKPDVPYGVRDYKKKFGGEVVNRGRYYLVHDRVKMKIAETGFEVLRKLKGRL